MKYLIAKFIIQLPPYLYDLFLAMLHRFEDYSLKGQKRGNNKPQLPYSSIQYFYNSEDHILEDILKKVLDGQLTLNVCTYPYIIVCRYTVGVDLKMIPL